MSVTYVVIRAEEDPEWAERPIRWRPERGPYGPGGPGDPPRSQAVWVWGLFRRRPRRLEEVAKELRISRNQVHACLSRLRAHGHVIELEGDKYYCDRRREAGEAAPLSPPRPAIHWPGCIGASSSEFQGSGEPGAARRRPTRARSSR